MCTDYIKMILITRFAMNVVLQHPFGLQKIKTISRNAASLVDESSHQLPVGRFTEDAILIERLREHAFKPPIISRIDLLRLSMRMDQPERTHKRSFIGPASLRVPQKNQGNDTCEKQRSTHQEGPVRRYIRVGEYRVRKKSQA